MLSSSTNLCLKKGGKIVVLSRHKLWLKWASYAQALSRTAGLGKTHGFVPKLEGVFAQPYAQEPIQNNSVVVSLYPLYTGSVTNVAKYRKVII